MELNTHTHTLNQIKPTDIISTYFSITNPLSTLDIYVEIEVDSQWDCKSPALTFQLCLSVTQECLSSFVSSLVHYRSNQRSVILREKHLLVFWFISCHVLQRRFTRTNMMWNLPSLHTLWVDQLNLSRTDDWLITRIKIKEMKEKRGKTAHCFVCSHETLIDEAFRSNKVFVRQCLVEALKFIKVSWEQIKQCAVLFYFIFALLWFWTEEDREKYKSLSH